MDIIIFTNAENFDVEMRILGVDTMGNHGWRRPRLARVRHLEHYHSCRVYTT